MEHCRNQNVLTTLTSWTNSKPNVTPYILLFCSGIGCASLLYPFSSSLIKLCSIDSCEPVKVKKNKMFLSYANNIHLQYSLYISQSFHEPSGPKLPDVSRFLNKINKLKNYPYCKEYSVFVSLAIGPGR